MSTWRMYLCQRYSRIVILCTTVWMLYALSSCYYLAIASSSSNDVSFTPTTIFLADFENLNGDNDWMLGTGASDGNWIIGVASPYATGGNQMEINAFDGMQALMTGINNSQDLDGGPAVAESPHIILSSSATDIELNFEYYFSHYSNSSIDDNFIIEIRDANNDALLQTLINETGDATLRPAQYVSFQQNITSLAGNTIYIRLTAQDLANGSKVECAIDRIEIIQDDPNVGGTPVCDNLITDGFESSYGNWVDGGSDCFRDNDGTYANSGTYSVRLRDNTNSSVVTTGPYDLTNVEEAIVDFSYIARSMENGEDFWLQVSLDGGTTYTTVETWSRGLEFENLVREDENVIISGPFSNSTLFRFRCDASGNGDFVYLDDISIDTCSTQVVNNCFSLQLTDTTLCNDMSMGLTPAISGLTVPINSHLWTVLPTSTATGYTLSGDTTPTLNIDAVGSGPGTLDLMYVATDDNGCVKSVEASIFILGVEPCVIRIESDTICSSASAMLDATAIYQVLPDSGVVISASSGSGNTVIHDIIGVQDPTGVKVTITLPTWDDHFSETILNGNTIFPEVLEPDSWGAGGMDIVNPWNANVNGLPRSIITIENNEVHYYISQTVNSTEMMEVFPTNWITTPQNFVPGNNTLQFGIENTAGPVSGSWFLEAEGISGYSYLWTTGDTTNMLNISPTQTSTYGVTVTAPNGCSYYCEKTVYIHDFQVAVEDESLCLGDTISLVGSIFPDVSGPYLHQWTVLSGPPGLSLIGDDQFSVVIDATGVNDTGEAVIIYEAIDKFGCASTDTFKVEILNIPTLSCYYQIDEESMQIGNCNVSGCPGSTVFFGVDSTISNISWIGPNGFTESGPSINLTELSYLDTGTYTAQYMLGSCMVFKDFHLNILAPDDIVFYADFESNSGDNNWSVIGGASDGDWVVGTPNPYSTGGMPLEIAAYEGNNSLLTGSGATQDLDGGPSVVRSPLFILPDSAFLDLRYYYSFYTNASSDDYFNLLLKRSIDDSVLDTLITLKANMIGQEAIWSQVVRSLDSFSGETVYFEGIAADVSNQSKIEVALDQIIVNTRNECSCVETRNANLSYEGCEDDGYSITINGIVYDEMNPNGIELLRTAEGCDSIVNVNLNFEQNVSQTVDYIGCSGDGYAIIVNNITYDESNPIGQEVLLSSTGCDSIINIELLYNPKVEVEAGMLPYPICSNSNVDLSAIGAGISGGTDTGQWSTMGDGTFDVNGIYNISGSATTYTLGPMDIDKGEVILTLTSTDPPGPCEPDADAVLILINDMRCSQFPWAGN